MTGSRAPKAVVVVSWILRIVIALVLGMAAFFKLTGDPGSAAMFEFLGAPWARVVVGACEALAAVLVLIPRTVLFGAMLSAALMIGAVFAHLTKLGIKLKPVEIAGGDATKAQQLSDAGLEGPGMFLMAVGVLLASVAVIILRVVVSGARAKAAHPAG